LLSVVSFSLSTDAVIQILSTIVLASVAIVSAVVASRYTEKYRDQSESTAEHFKQIKANVLAPMLNQTDEYYLPILGFKKENLSYDRSETRNYAAGLSEQPTVSEVVAVVAPPTSPRSRLVQDEDDKSRIEVQLFKDCQANHFKAVFSEWEKLTSRVDKFNRECLDLANSITASVAKKLSLPIGKDWEQAEPNVTPYCGIAIFNRMAGMGVSFLSTSMQNTQAGLRQRLSFGNTIIDMMPSGDTNKAKSIIDEEIRENKDRFFQLKATADSIDKEFVKFRVRLATLMEKQKLPGRCDYL